MTNRHPAIVIVLCFFTCGLYHIYWFVNTKIEMNRRGADIPTAWLILIPFVNIYWLWRWSQGVEKVTSSGLTAIGRPISQVRMTAPIIMISRATTKMTSQRGIAPAIPSDT